MRADFCADVLPGFASDGKIWVVDHNDEMGIARGDGGSGDGAAVAEIDGLLRSHGNSHPGGDFNGIWAAIFNRVDAAHAKAGIGLDSKFVAGLRVDCLGHPCGDASGAVAADFSDRAIGVVQANTSGFCAGPREEFNAICANAGIARAEMACEFGPDRVLPRLLQ